jgi:hypothetical protein
LAIRILLLIALPPVSVHDVASEHAGDLLLQGCAADLRAT